MAIGFAYFLVATDSPEGKVPVAKAISTETMKVSVGSIL